MEKYKITFKKSVAKDFKSINPKDTGKILERIQSLADNPRGEGCVKLSAKNNYRVRQGLYRIVYEIKDSELVINVVAVAHRSKVYKGL